MRVADRLRYLPVKASEFTVLAAADKGRFAVVCYGDRLKSARYCRPAHFIDRVFRVKGIE